MAWANVQQNLTKPTFSGSNTVSAYTSNVANGTLLIAAIANSQNESITGTPTDTRGSTWANACQQTLSGLGFCYIYYAISAGAGANSLTIPWSGTTGTNQVWLYEFSGNASSSPLDKTHTATGATTAVSSGNTATTTNATELLFGWLYPLDGISAGEAGWTVHIDAPSGTATEWQATTVTGAYAATGTDSSATNWIALIATFLPSAGGTPVNVTVSMTGKNTSNPFNPLIIRNATLSI